MRHRTLSCVAFALTLCAATSAYAQNPVLEPDTMLVADTIPHEPPSPRGAFIRAALVPGLGHVYIGEYTRGAVYLSIQSASWFMLVKTLRKLDQVEDRDQLLTALAVDSVRGAMWMDPVLNKQLRDDPLAFEAALLTYPGLQTARSLARARRQQRQDWVTYTLFFTFAAAVDAYVTAHLKEFPAEVTLRPAGGDGLEMRVRLPFGGRH
jgi:hypothetical protein